MDVAAAVNEQLFRAARRAGCSRNEAEIIAAYVGAETLEAAAVELNITKRTALRRLAAARRRMNVAHTSALVALLAFRPAPPSVARP